MTLQEFKYLLQPGNLLDSPEREINICYTGSKVQSIAIRIENNNLLQLQQATAVAIKLPQAGSTLNISLESSQLPIRTVDRDRVGNYYIYSILEEDQQPEMSTIPVPVGILPSEDYSGSVIILPSQEQVNFTVSDYEVLKNNSLLNRVSTYIQQCDRTQLSGSSINPVNLPSILVDNAIPANIQDSNYSDTGWISARYLGSKTNSSNYGGVDPAITGGTFNGAFFPQTYTEAQIRALASTDIKYVEYFYTGKLDAPTCTILPINNPFAWNPYNISEAATTFKISIFDNSVNLQPGDLITMQNGTFNIDTTEVCKVLAVRSLNIGNTLLEVDVIRGFGGSQKYSYSGSISFGSSEAEIYQIPATQIYTLEVNKIQGILAGKLLIRDSQELLYINSAAYAISGSKQ